MPSIATRPRDVPTIRSLMPDGAALRAARRRLFAKAAFTTAVFLASYGVLVLVDVGWVVKVVAGVLLVHALLAIATGIMHDANHGSFSANPSVNRMLAYSADFLGASSWLWRKNHNVSHHHWTNVLGKDNDIELAPFARLAPGQKHRPWHRFQHVYLWVLYGFLTTKWLVFGDFQSWVKDRETLRARTPHFWRTSAIMVAWKLVHCAWAIAVPLLMHPWWQVLTAYLIISWAVGFALAVIFQLAHCVDNADFLPSAPELSGDHALRHQLNTTVDFAGRTRLGRWYAAWLLGGLDYQVEHHLAPRLPHTYYRHMAVRVDDLCAQRNWNRRTHRSFLTGVRSHARHLRTMGRAV